MHFSYTYAFSNVSCLNQYAILIIKTDVNTKQIKKKKIVSMVHFELH